MSTQMQQLVEKFVTDLSSLFRQQALQALGAVDMQKKPSAVSRLVETVAAAMPSASPGRAGVRAKGEKRSAEEIESLSKKFLDYVTAKPGLRIEQVNKALSTTTKDLQLPIRKMIADGVLKVKGAKRSTTYYAR